MAKTLDDLVNEALQNVEEISVEEAARILEQPDREGWAFLDVREADEFSAGRVPGARHSPRGFLEVRADLTHPKRDPWFTDRDRPMILYCGGGNRSALAARALVEMGFTRILSLCGGFAKWRDEGRPIEK
ncbi:MAG: rhodanese-like domain-containing protein [Myxococcota bacterium]